MKNEELKNAKNFDELLDIKYGEIGNEKRDEFEKKAQYFVISEMLKGSPERSQIDPRTIS